MGPKPKPKPQSPEEIRKRQQIKELLDSNEAESNELSKSYKGPTLELGALKMLLLDAETRLKKKGTSCDVKKMDPEKIASIDMCSDLLGAEREIENLEPADPGLEALKSKVADLKASLRAREPGWFSDNASDSSSDEDSEAPPELTVTPLSDGESAALDEVPRILAATSEHVNSAVEGGNPGVFMKAEGVPADFATQIRETMSASSSDAEVTENRDRLYHMMAGFVDTVGYVVYRSKKSPLISQLNRVAEAFGIPDDAVRHFKADAAVEGKPAPEPFSDVQKTMLESVEDVSFLLISFAHLLGLPSANALGKRDVVICEHFLSGVPASFLRTFPEKSETPNRPFRRHLYTFCFVAMNYVIDNSAKLQKVLGVPVETDALSQYISGLCNAFGMNPRRSIEFTPMAKLTSTLKAAHKDLRSFLDGEQARQAEIASCLLRSHAQLNNMSGVMEASDFSVRDRKRIGDRVKCHVDALTLHRSKLSELIEEEDTLRDCAVAFLELIRVVSRCGKIDDIRRDALESFAKRLRRALRLPGHVRDVD